MYADCLLNWGIFDDKKIVTIKIINDNQPKTQRLVTLKAIFEGLAGLCDCKCFAILFSVLSDQSQFNCFSLMSPSDSLFVVKCQFTIQKYSHVSQLCEYSRVTFFSISTIRGINLINKEKRKKMLKRIQSDLHV